MFSTPNGLNELLELYFGFSFTLIYGVRLETKLESFVRVVETYYVGCAIISCRRTPSPYGWPFVAKFNNVYLYPTIYIDSTSTQDIFSQRLYSFNFNTRYFHSTTILIQLQHGLFLWKTNIYSTSTPKVIFYETNIFIQLQQKNIFVQQNIFIQLFKFLDIDEFLFNKAPPPYTPAAPSLKTWKQHI